jgi:hypothetical protein
VTYSNIIRDLFTAFIAFDLMVVFFPIMIARGFGIQPMCNKRYRNYKYKE